MTGKVKWFSKERGFGFIVPDGVAAGDKAREVFVHHTAIVSKGWKLLDEGERVEFQTVPGAKGPKAQSVIRL
jgi:CspA family cold shock protein